MHTRQLNHSIDQRNCHRRYLLLVWCHLWRSISCQRSHVTEWLYDKVHWGKLINVTWRVIKISYAMRSCVQCKICDSKTSNENTFSLIKAFLDYRKWNYKLWLWIRGNVMYGIEWRHDRPFCLLLLFYQPFLPTINGSFARFFLVYDFSLLAELSHSRLLRLTIWTLNWLSRGTVPTISEEFGIVDTKLTSST